MTMTPTKKTIEHVRYLDLPPERVYRALTDARQLEGWFPSKVETDVRVGGRIKFRFEALGPTADFHDHDREGVFTELVPGKRVAYTWRLPEGETLVTWDLKPKGSGTEIRLTHSGFGDSPQWRKHLEDHSGGWGFFLDNLAAVVKGQPDGRTANNQRTVRTWPST
jgi:uncharacterized protein YndB with AHSA1/START domain